MVEPAPSGTFETIRSPTAALSDGEEDGDGRDERHNGQIALTMIVIV
jgi:hypothetical protein